MESWNLKSPVCKIVPKYPCKITITDPGQWVASIKVKRQVSVDSSSKKMGVEQFKPIVRINDEGIPNLRTNNEAVISLQ